ncbi:hypothetical protein AVEN_149150-1 [Araneus ventricosus]|uniref:Uncharacterized protein n=1 Tax=Araneus ventricosus TaxID=182803 RepID=A0A4Y2LJX0_ARAVE|nr:hypothetical protein AVEN_149150-1 [Araneus ventricosus]
MSAGEEMSPGSDDESCPMKQSAVRRPVTAVRSGVGLEGRVGCGESLTKPQAAQRCAIHLFGVSAKGLSELKLAVKKTPTRIIGPPTTLINEAIYLRSHHASNLQQACCVKLNANCRQTSDSNP